MTMVIKLHAIDDMNLIERLAMYQINNPSIKYEFVSWQNAAFLIGLTHLDTISNKDVYYDYLLKIAKDNNYGLGKRIYHADDIAIGQVYLYLYNKNPSLNFIESSQERCNYIIKNPMNKNHLMFIGKNKTDSWSWCDSLYMAPRTWIELSIVTNNFKYKDYAIEHFWLTTSYLYDENQKLFYRDSTFFTLKETNGQKVFWSRGNGWVLSGLARILTVLKPNDSKRGKFEILFVEMSHRIKELQLTNGGWSTSLLNPQQYIESSGTSFFCYSIAWGINNGLLDSNKFLNTALSAYNSIISNCIDKSGRLLCVQPVGKSPEYFEKNSSEPFGVGAFILCSTEIIKLKKKISLHDHFII